MRHFLKRIGHHDDDGIGRRLPNPLADRGDDGRIDAGEIRPAHSGLPRATSGDDNIVGSGQRGGILSALDPRRETAQRGAVPHVEREACRKARNDVRQNDAREERRLSKPQRRHRADVTGANDCGGGAGIGGARCFRRIRLQGGWDWGAAAVERAGERGGVPPRARSSGTAAEARRLLARTAVPPPSPPARCGRQAPWPYQRRAA
jgi:hypothetical protein